MTVRSLRRAVALLFVAAIAAAPSAAQSVTIEPSQDTTMYSEGAFSNALHNSCFSGRTSQGRNRRALVQFDVAGNVPAGATITSATLEMSTLTSPQGGSDTSVSIHRLTGAWAEGTSNNEPLKGGTGDNATTGDATWANRVHPSTSWGNAGGDFVGTASASTSVTFLLGRFPWAGATVVADVQGWLDAPATNHGWILIGNEAQSKSARRWASRQHFIVSFPPTLTIEYTQGSTTSFCDDADGSLASCPCSNPGAPDTGCDIQQGTGGVLLDIVQQETSPSNGLTLSGTGFPPTSTPAAIVIRAAALDPGSPIVFGDGLRCIGVPLVRLGAAFAAAGTSTHTFGHGVMAGSGDFYYQLWFRNTPIMFCDPAAAFNLSNGRIASW